jgi:atypical dual specificity phosphatase
MITRVWERLCLGSVKDAEHLASANPRGITTVVSLCPEQVVHRAGNVSYVRIPIADACPISARQFEAVMAAVSAHIRTGAVLLNCAAGMSRSPIFVAAWMHRCGYLHLEAALQEIADLRPIIDPSPGLLKSVKEHLAR